MRRHISLTTFALKRKEIEEVLFLAILCGGMEKVVTPDGKTIDGKDLRYLPAFAAIDLLNDLEDDPDYLYKFFLSPEDKSRIFGKYWEKYSSQVKEIQAYLKQKEKKEKK